MLDPAVRPPVTETAVVCHPRDEQVEGVGLPDYVRPPGGEARLLSVALREADRQLLQDWATPAAPGGLAVTGASQAGASQGTVQVSPAAQRGGEEESWGAQLGSDIKRFLATPVRQFY